MIKFVLSQNDENQRLDKFLKKYLRNAPLSHIYKLIRKDVKVNGRKEKPDRILEPGDEITIYISDDEEMIFRGDKKSAKQTRQFDIAYEDKNLLIVCKPFGLLTHGSRSEKKKTLTNQVISYLIETGEFNPSERSFSPAPVNRLDRNTTGLVIFGKNSNTLKNFNSMLRKGNCIRKYYLTIVAGKLKGDLILRGKLAKDTSENRVSIFEGSETCGKEIETLVKVIDNVNGFSLVEVELVTGRTHQIRAHLAHEGYPIIGDAKYGDQRLNHDISKKYGLTTQLLHAERLSFNNMSAGFEYLNGIEVKAAIPAEFRRIKEELNK